MCETTIPSYLTARPSRDILLQAHQQVTSEWWYQQRHNFNLFVSQVVLAEVACGDPQAAADRLSMLSGIPVLAVAPELVELAELYRRELQIPLPAAADATHLAYTVYYEVEYLLTWNCTHLQNPVLMRKMAILNTSRGLHVTRQYTRTNARDV